MKKFIIFIMLSLICSVPVDAQHKKSTTKKTTTSVQQKAKSKAAAEAKAKAAAEAEAKAAAEAEAKAAAEAEAKAAAEAEAKAIALNNSKCEFEFSYSGIVSKQDRTKDFVIYEVPGMSASEIKAAVVSTISSLYKSPKDALNHLGDNIIQLNGYASNVYWHKVETSSYPIDFSFSIVIQFKDGKIRYNVPTIIQIYEKNIPMIGTVEFDMSKPLHYLIKEEKERNSTVQYFNRLLNNINSKIKSSNDW